MSGSSPAGAVARANESARLFLEVMARFSPEVATQIGFAAADQRVFDLEEDYLGRYRTAINRSVRRGYIIARADLAGAILKLLDDPTASHAAIGIGY